MLHECPNKKCGSYNKPSADGCYTCGCNDAASLKTEQAEASILSDLLSDDPWPLKDVLTKLVEATNILLNDHGYDGHGWELINAARDRAVEIAKGI